MNTFVNGNLFTNRATMHEIKSLHHGHSYVCACTKNNSLYSGWKSTPLDTTQISYSQMQYLFLNLNYDVILGRYKQYHIIT
jgi:hypothetical protein